MPPSSKQSVNCFLLLLFVVSDFGLTEDVGGEDEILKGFVGGIHDLLVGALPLGTSVADESDVLANSHDGIHVVGVDNGCDLVFVRDTLDEFVDDDGGLWVESRIGFVAEEVTGLEDNGTGDGNSLLHTA